MRTFLHSLVVKLIHFVRWVQFLIFQLSLPLLKTYSQNFAKRVGITLNGSNPHDIRVKSDDVYSRICAYGSLGLAETYIEGLWECDDLAGFLYRILKGEIYRNPLGFIDRMLNKVELTWFNNQTKEKAWEVGKKHYDAGNDLFEIMLGPSMNYSCAYWRNATTLDEAQRDKMDLIARKLKLKKGMKVLDIGCGWGSMSKYLAENYGVEVVGITVSKEGADYSTNTCSGLSVDIRLMDYRDLDEEFDRIIGIEVLFHIGKKNFNSFFNTVRKCLKDDGLLFLHVVGVNHNNFPLVDSFYNVMLPNCQFIYYKDIMNEIEGKFIIEDWQNIGYDFAKTAQAWFKNFEKGWGKIDKKYDGKFFRMWEYFLKILQAAFETRKMHIWHLVLSKNGNDGGYYAER